MELVDNHTKFSRQSTIQYFIDKYIALEYNKFHIFHKYMEVNYGETKSFRESKEERFRRIVERSGVTYGDKRQG